MTDTVPEASTRNSLRAEMQGLTFAGQTAVRAFKNNAASTEAWQRQGLQGALRFPSIARQKAAKLSLLSVCGMES